ncbi:hypothetical protein [Oceaniglobus roseus]|uniref:hypothetical protein n=1 Tax=Oceaniglobus roseus TaxID=1737570 RepID=UPI000C7F150D|nr:hypothetical protein [Kandeliimicrobium roseum]
MQPTSSIAVLPGAGGSGGIGEGWRNVQAALQAMQALRGRSIGSGPATLSSRPVLAPEAAERGTVRPDLRARVATQRIGTDIPTGPRPTFERTPLEKMRIEALDPAVPGPIAEVEGVAGPAAGGLRPALLRSDVPPVDPALLVAYSGLRTLDKDSASGRRLDTLR